MEKREIGEKRPGWLDTEAYPFTPRYLDLPMGRMHYVDEGISDHALVMLHGNPAWSFMFRHLIEALSGEYRCIAPDHIGFGLSDKPQDWDYLPESHARNFEKLMEHSGAESLTLMVGDWGGPIGLSYAIRHPERVRSVILTNTWMWPVRGIAHYEMFSRFMGGAAGRVLIRKYNFFVDVLMKRMFRSGMTDPVHEHYRQPLQNPEERKGCWVFPGQILAANDWLTGLWEKRRALADKPALIVWGERDIAFRALELEKWRSLFPDAHVHVCPVGHFVAEELGTALCPLVKKHLESVCAGS